jgi:hypothetical protein
VSGFDELDRAAQRAAFAHMAGKDKGGSRLAAFRRMAEANKARAAARDAATKSAVARAAENTPHQLAPPKPKRMSEKRYRELYDSEPHYVEAPGVRYKVAGLVSAQAVVNSLRRSGVEPTVRPVDPARAKKRAADLMRAADKKK